MIRRLAAVIMPLLCLSVGCASVAPTPAAQSLASEPSASAKQVCSPDHGQRDLARALGVIPTWVEPPTWQDHLYTCRYIYPSGSFTLSVKQLPDISQTDVYFDRLRAPLGDVEDLDGIGEASYYTRNGSIVARKDAKVLLVDVAGLPRQFGDPPVPPADISRTIATIIMGCWSGD